MSEKFKTNSLFLFLDVSRCVGCHTCEVACKQEYGSKRIEVRDIGPVLVEGGNPAMEAVIFTFDTCDICTGKEIQGAPTACIKACPTDALFVTGEKEAIESLTKPNVNLCNHEKPD